VTQTWNPLRTWWNHVMRVLLVALVLCASACTGPGHFGSEPSASAETCLAGPPRPGCGDRLQWQRVESAALMQEVEGVGKARAQEGIPALTGVVEEIHAVKKPPFYASVIPQSHTKHPLYLSLPGGVM
jgi:hypothetical protein